MLDILEYIDKIIIYLVNNINKNIIKELKLIELMINSLIILIKLLNVLKLYIIVN